MLYQLLKILMKVALRLFYKHLHVEGLQHVPLKGPAIIIANHPSSLMDAALIGIVLKRPVYFFTRGDVFINPLVNRILSWMHMLPVHNHEKGRHTLSSNTGSFSTAQQVLLQGGIIVFFPESSSHTERQLLPFRKGVFRLAFQTLVSAGFSFDIPVVPLGITYEHPTKSRTNVLVKAGEPLLLLPYKEMYLKHPASALLHISKDAYDRMRQLVLHINDAHYFPAAETLLTINRNNRLFHDKPWYIASDVQLQSEREICDKINNGNGPLLQQLLKNSADYERELAESRLSDTALAPVAAAAQQHGTAMLLVYPVWFIVCSLNILPLLLAQAIVKRKVVRIDFYSWLFVVISILLYAGWVLLLASLALFIIGWVPALVLLITLPLSLTIGVHCRTILRKQKQLALLKRLPPQQLQQLTQMRKEICAFI